MAVNVIMMLNNVIECILCDIFVTEILSEVPEAELAVISKYWYTTLVTLASDSRNLECTRAVPLNCRLCL